MKKLLLLIIFFISCHYSFAQIARRYTYDESGKRIRRDVMVFRIDGDSTQPDYGINVYPNPASNEINVSISNLPKDAKVMIQLLDNSGKKILELKKPLQQETINMKKFASGIYYLHIMINDDKKIYRVVKQE